MARIAYEKVETDSSKESKTIFDDLKLLREIVRSMLMWAKGALPVWHRGQESCSKYQFYLL